MTASKKNSRSSKGELERKKSKQSDEFGATPVPDTNLTENAADAGLTDAAANLAEALNGAGPLDSTDGQPISPSAVQQAEETMDEPTLTELIVESYEGGRERGVFEGEGVCIFTSGNFYSGNFHDGMMHGLGKYIWQESGITYEGDFLNNHITGRGTYFWPDGSTYEGDVLDGIRHGLGVYRHPNGVSYSGNWDFGKRHGEGRLDYDTEGRSFYEGEWRQNIRHGWGFRQYPSGNTYEGAWYNGQRHGQGCMRWLDRNEAYTGQWENGIQQGMGQHVWFVTRVTGSQYPLRNLYDGEFDKAKRHGWGSFYYPNGARYEGQWVNNVKSGQGKFIFKNGRVFEGIFEIDRIKEYPSFSMDGRTTPDLEQIRTRSPLPCETASVRSNESRNTEGPSFQLYLDWVGKHLPDNTDVLQLEEEAQQTLQVVARHLGALRRIYHFYSSLGLSDEQLRDNTHILSVLQFWRLMKDARLHHLDMELVEIDRVIAGAADSPSSTYDLHNPWKNILFIDFVNHLVTLSFKLYSDEETGKNGAVTPRSPRSALLATCMERLISEQLLPYACTVHGPLFSDNKRAQQALKHAEKAYTVFLNSCKPSKKAPHEPVLRMRELLLLLKEYCLINENMTAKAVVDILAADDPTVADPDFINLEKEITFLEYFECLIGCAEVFVTDAVIQNPDTPRPENPTSARSADGRIGAQSVESMAVTEAQDAESNIDSEGRTPDPMATASASEVTIGTAAMQSDTRTTAGHRSSHKKSKSSASRQQVSSNLAPGAGAAQSGAPQTSHRTSGTEKIKEVDPEAVASVVTLVQSEAGEEELMSPMATPGVGIQDTSRTEEAADKPDEDEEEEAQETPVSPATRAFNFWTHQVHIFFVRKFFVAADKLSVLEGRLRDREETIEPEEESVDDIVEVLQEVEIENQKGEVSLEVPPQIET